MILIMYKKCVLIIFFESVLEKPFLMEDLIAKIEAVLGPVEK